VRRQSVEVDDVLFDLRHGVERFDASPREYDDASHGIVVGKKAQAFTADEPCRAKEHYRSKVRVRAGRIDRLRLAAFQPRLRLLHRSSRSP
jgi:hypothetical protein